jgi:23S rRNA (cytidine1920-2'-O)/16S rRNA (cytidine1409-2'-O)-methyltransferase
MRLDLFVKDKLNISRQKAREIIEQGLVTIDNKIITKPSYNVNSDANISIGSTESILKYVGRGGYKLEKAIEFFNINLNVSLIAVSLSEVFLPAFPFKVKVLFEFG